MCEDKRSRGGRRSQRRPCPLAGGVRGPDEPDSGTVHTGRTPVPRPEVGARTAVGPAAQGRPWRSGRKAQASCPVVIGDNQTGGRRWPLCSQKDLLVSSAVLPQPFADGCTGVWPPRAASRRIGLRVVGPGTSGQGDRSRCVWCTRPAVQAPISPKSGSQMGVSGIL